MLVINDKTGGQRKAPLYAAVRSHLRKEYRSLHVPLHGGGAGAPDLLRGGFSTALRWDLTEVGALDDLHLPRGVIGRAQALAAELFGAVDTFFLVNGVTGGLLAIFPALCRPGEKVLLTRLAHKAVLHGIALSGARPVYLPVERDRRSGFPLNVSTKTVAGALREHPEARLLLVTSPSYWGVTADLDAIKRVTVRHGVILAVDEAHGTHFPFYREKLPHSAVAGADLWLQSAHKSLGSLTPGAFLHLGPGAQPFASALRFWLQALQTSSPPYPLLVSLDLVRRQAALRGKALFSAAWDWAVRLRRELSGSDFTLLTAGQGENRDAVGSGGRDGGGEFQLDPCRVTILFPRGRKGEATGEVLARKLAQKYRWQVEMSGRGYLLAIIGPSHLSFSPRKLARALQGAADDCDNCAGRANLVHRANFDSHAKRAGQANYADCAKSGVARPGDFPSTFFRLGDDLPAGPGLKPGRIFPPFPLTPEEALRRPCTSIPLKIAASKICAEMIVLSPPGIPLLAPGEAISAAVLEHILEQRAKGRLFQGAADPALRTIKVVGEDAGVVE